MLADKIELCRKDILKVSENKKIQPETIKKYCEKHKLKTWIIKQILNA